MSFYFQIKIKFLIKLEILETVKILHLKRYYERESTIFSHSKIIEKSKTFILLTFLIMCIVMDCQRDNK